METELHLLWAWWRAAEFNFVWLDKTVGESPLTFEEKENSLRAEESWEVHRLTINVQIIVHYSSLRIAPLLLARPAWGTQEHHYRGKEAQL